MAKVIKNGIGGSDGVPEASMEISEDGKDVIINFDRPVVRLAVSPSEAARVGETLARAAYNVHSGSRGPLEKPGEQALSYYLRQRCINRVALMLVSLREQQKPDSYSAEAIVDTLFSMVL